MLYGGGFQVEDAQGLIDGNDLRGRVRSCV